MTPQSVLIIHARDASKCPLFCSGAGKKYKDGQCASSAPAAAAAAAAAFETEQAKDDAEFDKELDEEMNAEL